MNSRKLTAILIAIIILFGAVIVGLIVHERRVENASGQDQFIPDEPFKVDDIDVDVSGVVVENPNRGSLENNNGKYVIGCVGDSLTAGGGVSDPATESYPAYLDTYLGDMFTVNNYGVGGATLRVGTGADYTNTPQYQQSIADQCDAYIIMLGSNDINNMWDPEEFKRQFDICVNTYYSLPNNPVIFLSTPAFPFVDGVVSGYPMRVVFQDQIVPTYKEMCAKYGATLIPTLDITMGRGELYSDLLHPNAQGYQLIAQQAAQIVMEYFQTYVMPYADASLPDAYPTMTTPVDDPELH